MQVLLTNSHTAKSRYRQQTVRNVDALAGASNTVINRGGKSRTQHVIYFRKVRWVEVKHFPNDVSTAEHLARPVDDGGAVFVGRAEGRGKGEGVSSRRRSTKSTAEMRLHICMNANGGAVESWRGRAISGG